jgi:hypothetical protein
VHLFGKLSCPNAVDRQRVRQLLDERRDVVITWGFVPDSQLRAVLELRGLGFEWLWFDGDRELALKNYLSLRRTRSDWDRQLGKGRAVHRPTVADSRASNREPLP